MLGDVPVSYCGRPESASPAAGSFKSHEREEQKFVAEALSTALQKKGARSKAPA
jgi:2-oxoglutarate dehydrogenase complex dehydrogenase (E1) component-like enzyme